MGISALTAGLIGGGIGFGAASIFGKKKAKTPSMPQLSEYGQWAQDELYKTVGRGLTGGGLIPQNMRTKGFAGLRRDLTKGFVEAQPMLASFLNRMVPRADTKVRGYADEMLKRSYYGGMQDIRDEEKLAPYEEQLESMNAASQLLGGEKQMSAGVMDIYNRGQYAESQLPTFGSQLGYGLGSAGGIYAAQRYAQLMSNRGIS
jgi:hypothetical protein